MLKVPTLHHTGFLRDQPPSLGDPEVTSLTQQQRHYHSHHWGNSKGFRSSVLDQEYDQIHIS